MKLSRLPAIALLMVQLVFAGLANGQGIGVGQTPSRSACEIGHDAKLARQKGYWQPGQAVPAKEPAKEAPRKGQAGKPAEKSPSSSSGKTRPVPLGLCDGS